VVEGLYHVWFSIKGRKQALEGELGGDARRLLIETAQRMGIRLVEVEVTADHAHLLVALTGTQTLPSVMHQLKGASARYIFLKYPDLRFDLGHNSFWQKGYGWHKITPAEVPAVRHYIRAQGDQPLRHSV
jgi:putative transposase